LPWRRADELFDLNKEEAIKVSRQEQDEKDCDERSNAHLLLGLAPQPLELIYHCPPGLEVENLIGAQSCLYAVECNDMKIACLGPLIEAGIIYLAQT
jgi:hypothetical protein